MGVIVCDRDAAGGTVRPVPPAGHAAARPTGRRVTLAALRAPSVTFHLVEDAVVAVVLDDGP